MKIVPTPPPSPSTPSGLCRPTVAGLIAATLAFPVLAKAAGITERKDISYLSIPAPDSYAADQCRLDLYLPRDATNFPLLVWFHGGGLKGGARTGGASVAAAKSLAENGVGVILAGYRLSPHVTFPAYVHDAAQAVRWAVNHAVELKAQPRVYVGGHSAGGYLAALLAVDPQHLAEAGVQPDDVAGFVSMSSQMTTHFTVAEERGLSSSVITADDAAPIHHLRKNTAPMLILIGDDDWPARLEENAYFVAAMRRVAENPNLSFQVIAGRTHSGILQSLARPAEPAARVVREFLLSGKLPPDNPPPPSKKPGAPAAASPTPAGNP
jgi:acetyl esterase/lipase